MHILKTLKKPGNDDRLVALYHRNSSEERKEEILHDLKIPLDSNDKKLQCVVSTVSLGWSELFTFLWSNLVSLPIYALHVAMFMLNYITLYRLF